MKLNFLNMKNLRKNNYIKESFYIHCFRNYKSQNDNTLKNVQQLTLFIHLNVCASKKK